MPGLSRPHSWNCPACRQPLGTTRRAVTWQWAGQSILTVNHRAIRVDQRITTWVVHCECGGYRTWSDGTIQGHKRT